jgi:hypothetical protein
MKYLFIYWQFMTNKQTKNELHDMYTKKDILHTFIVFIYYISKK